MDTNDFKKSLAATAPPSGARIPLQALWHDGRGDWHAAHDLLQKDDSADSAWVHAYLHRKEGDLGNAGYWYRRAGKPTASGSLESEWEQIVGVLISAARP